MEIIKYDSDKLRDYARVVSKEYKENMKTMLPFDSWIKKSLPIIKNNMKVKDKYPKTINIAPSTKEMLKILEEHSKEIYETNNDPDINARPLKTMELYKRILKPSKQIIIEEPIIDSLTGTEIWFGDSTNGVDLYIGYENGNSSLPTCMTLSEPKPNEASVHIKIAGGTGSGKSVSIHALNVTTQMIYPPWEVRLLDIDYKLQELIKYASPISCPHVEAVAASTNMTYDKSIYEELAEETDRRSKIWSIVGVNGIDAFRKKFGMVVPRYILMNDEFGQIDRIITALELAGSTKANEIKGDINRAIFNVATLGRSQGCHMVISSQSTVGCLSGFSDKQFSGGLCLKVNNSEDSKDVLGNTKAAFIQKIGQGYINLNRGEGKEEDNKLVVIPFLETNHEIKNGKSELPYLTKCLMMFNDLCKKYGYSYNLISYSDTELPPNSAFISDIELAEQVFKDSPYTGEDTKSTINREVFKSQTAISLAVGRIIKYTENNKYQLHLKRRLKENIIISGQRFVNYGLKMVAENIKYYKNQGIRVDNRVIIGDLAQFKLASLEETLGLIDSRNTWTKSAKLPFNLKNAINLRLDLMKLSDCLQENHVEENGVYFDLKLAWKLYTDEEESTPSGSYGKTIWRLMSIDKLSFNYGLEKLKECDIIGENSNTEIVKELLNSLELDINPDILGIIESWIGNKRSVIKTYKSITNFNRYINIDDFPLTFYWMLGIDNYTEVINNDIDAMKEFTNLMGQGPKVNIFGILTSNNWSKCSNLIPMANIVLEREVKSFFSEIGIPCLVNPTENTFQIHNLEDAKQLVQLKQYKFD